VIKIRSGPGEIVVCPTGDLDRVASLLLRRQFDKLLQPGLKVIIDLAHTSFIDAAGLIAISAWVSQVRVCVEVLSHRRWAAGVSWPHSGL
jgi:anti-anti-sigma regulatory factor